MVGEFGLNLLIDYEKISIRMKNTILILCVEGRIFQIQHCAVFGRASSQLSVKCPSVKISRALFRLKSKKKYAAIFKSQQLGEIYRSLFSNGFIACHVMIGIAISRIFLRITQRIICEKIF